MKPNLTIQKRHLLCCVLFLMIFTVNSYSQLGPGDYNLCVKNMHQTSPSVLEFDVFLEWDNPNNTNLFNFFAGGLDFNYAGLANGGTISAMYVSGSADPAIPAPANNPTWTLNQTSKQIRFLASVVSPASNSVAVPPSPGWRLGTLRLTNTVPFTPNTSQNFVWNYTTGSNRTQTKEAFYVNGSSFETAFVDAGGVNHCPFPPPCLGVPCPTADAGGPYSSCGDIHLNGSIANATTGTWTTSGSGSFDPNATTLNATYHPSVSDLNNGSVTLTLTTDAGNQNPCSGSGCSPAVSSVLINFTPINDNVLCTVDGCNQSTGNPTHTPLTLNCSGRNVICFGANNGTASVISNSGTGPITFNWTTGSGTPATININPSKDNNIYFDNQSNSNAKGEHLAIGNDNLGVAHRALMAFNIAGSIPPGSVITSATLQLHLSNLAPGSGVQSMELHNILASWGEGTSNTTVTGQGTAATTGDATWLDRFFPATLWINVGGDFNASSSAATNVNGIGFNNWSSAGMVTDIQNWLDTPANDNGWLIKGTESGTSQSKRFDSREVSTPSFRPVLTVNYIAPPPSLGTSNTLSNLAPGTYCVKARDANGCTATCCFTVLEAPPTNDGNACTTDACNTSTGAVTHTTVNVDDGNACTTDACDTFTGAVTHSQISVDDGNACTTDACNTSTGAVTHTTVNVDDGNACTTDACNTSNGAVSHSQISVDDGNACTTDACNTQTGSISHTEVPTDDGIPCTTDGCNSITGVFHTPVNCVSITLHSNIFLEGYYIGSGLMNNCLFATSVSSNPLDADLITISAMNPSSPFALVDSKTDTLKTNGDVTVIFSPSVIVNNSYYLKVTHRNAITTWSANPVLMLASTTYIFSDAANKAYGNNQIGTHLIGASTDGFGFAFYSGDIADGNPPGSSVQDGSIDASDFLDLDPHIQNGDGGYIISDLNGDGSVDATDFLILDPNIQQGIGSSVPTP